jgi:hypothetical protein
MKQLLDSEYVYMQLLTSRKSVLLVEACRRDILISASGTNSGAPVANGMRVRG